MFTFQHENTEKKATYDDLGIITTLYNGSDQNNLEYDIFKTTVKYKNYNFDVQLSTNKNQFKNTINQLFKNIVIQ